MVDMDEFMESGRTKIEILKIEDRMIERKAVIGYQEDTTLRLLRRKLKNTKPKG